MLVSLSVYLELLIQFLLNPLCYMHQRHLPFTEFGPCFELQVRRTPKTIPDSQKEKFVIIVLSFQTSFMKRMSTLMGFSLNDCFISIKKKKYILAVFKEEKSKNTEENMQNIYSMQQKQIFLYVVLIIFFLAPI